MTAFSVSVTAGGLFHCDPRWSRPNSYRADFNRIYIPISGRARYAIGGAWTDLRPGTVYFIPAHGDNLQRCDREMRVHWLHLTADSPQMAQGLARTRTLLSWPEADWRWWRPTYRRIAEHIAGGGTALSAAVHAFALAVASAAIERAPRDDDGRLAAERARFAPALALAESRFPAGVAIPALARAIGMSAVHFRRSFTRAFGVPPHAYLARKRMDAAAAMLAEGERPIGDIAFACGYEDPFYFSRTFKRHHHVGPAAFRRARLRAP